MTPNQFKIRYSAALARKLRRQFSTPAVQAADRRAVRHYESLPEYRVYLRECNRLALMVRMTLAKR